MWKGRKRGKSKFRNVKVTCDGHRFDSLLERDVYQFIKGMGWQVIEFQPKTYLTRAKILYKPDFKVICNNSDIPFYVEAKGLETATWRIKRRLWMSYGAGDLMVYKRRGSGLWLTETIRVENK